MGDVREMFAGKPRPRELWPFPFVASLPLTRSAAAGPRLRVAYAALRGRFVASLLSTIAPIVAITSCSEEPHPQVIVIGFDGMDPRLCERLMDEGRLPNLAKMRAGGGYKPLGTSIPPQSPVAWSNFITGADPGVHGIFDFIHRDPKHQWRPYYSAAKTQESDEGWEVGDHKLPLTFWPFNHNPTQTLLQRHGTPFWDYLDAAGIPIRIYDIPSNYPPSESHHGHMCCLSGMGVPDLLGTYGTYQFFSDQTPQAISEEGGRRSRIAFRENACKAVLIGPQNTALQQPLSSKIEFEIFRHPADAAARIDVQDKTIAMREGEWSDWVQVEFDLKMPAFLPTSRVPGICRFYLQQVRPEFRLYVTPVNIDPSDPGEQRISEPPEFVTDISDDLGLFYTAGFQEDYKALSNRVFKDEEYRQQAHYVFTERLTLLDHALRNYQDGFLFFYFSSTDLQAHMFWWEGDDPHPVRSPQEAKKYNGVIEDLYVQLDEVVGRVAKRFGDQATILVMSDHGFGNFGRQFHLNRWLRQNGYLQPDTARSLSEVDWSKTKAFGLGLNGLYVNLAGRERDGIVEPADRDALLAEISTKLLAVRDPKGDRPVVAAVYRSDEVYQGPHAAEAPDLIVGYHRNYRASWSTTLGSSIADELVTDNDSAWSADHCIAAEEVPGVVFSNKPITRSAPSLIDIAPTILAAYGLEKPEEMKGSGLFAPVP